MRLAAKVKGMPDRDAGHRVGKGVAAIVGRAQLLHHLSDQIPGVCPGGLGIDVEAGLRRDVGPGLLQRRIDPNQGPTQDLVPPLGVPSPHHCGKIGVEFGQAVLAVSAGNGLFFAHGFWLRWNA